MTTGKSPNKLCYGFEVNDSLKAMNLVSPPVDLLNERETSYQKAQNAMAFANLNAK